MISITHLDQVKAHILIDWDHPNCKFKPGEIALADSYPSDHWSGRQKKYFGEAGVVIAVSATNDGKIRGKNTWYRRCFTRYYLQFQDKEIVNFESHYLSNGPFQTKRT